MPEKKGTVCVGFFFVHEGGVAAWSGHWTQDQGVPGLNPDSASNCLSLSSDLVSECRVQCLVLQKRWETKIMCVHFEQMPGEILPAKTL